MKRFQFSFEHAMKWRDSVAQQERESLERLHANRSRLDEHHAAVRSEMREQGALLAHAAQISAADLGRAAEFMASLRRKESKLIEARARCTREVQAQTEKCIAADRDHKLLLNLRDKREAEWQRDFARETEQTAADAWQSARSRSNSRTNA